MSATTGLYLLANVGVTGANIVYTAPANTAIIALNATNKTNTMAVIDMFITRGGSNVYLCKGLSVTPNNTMLICGDYANKQFMNTNDILSAICYSANTFDLVMSVAIGVS